MSLICGRTSRQQLSSLRPPSLLRLPPKAASPQFCFRSNATSSDAAYQRRRRIRRASRKTLKDVHRSLDPPRQTTLGARLLTTLKLVWYGTKYKMSDPSSIPLTTTLSTIPPAAASRRLSAQDKPLVWIDCEMTGLNYETDRILEIAIIITNGQGEPIDEGVSYVISTPSSVLEAMDEWCTNQHGKSNLTSNCLNPEVAKNHTDVRAACLAYIRDRIPDERIACLAGNTVHADANFLRREFPELMNHLHYRIVDVSSIKELVARWYGPQYTWRAGRGSHRALDDIRASIAELKFYQEHYFKSPQQVQNHWDQ
ncbi:unnamed protein product [Sympodiomycopsis kandeliae]